jgi:hypothetical protein
MKEYLATDIRLRVYCIEMAVFGNKTFKWPLLHGADMQNLLRVAGLFQLGKHVQLFCNQ